MEDSSSTFRAQRQDLISLDPDGRPCEACQKPMHEHDWAELDEQGFVTACSNQS